MVGMECWGVQPAVPSYLRDRKGSQGCSACSDSWARETPPLCFRFLLREQKLTEQRGEVRQRLGYISAGLLWHGLVWPDRVHQSSAPPGRMKGCRPPQEGSGGGMERKVPSMTAISTSVGPSSPAGHPDQALAECQMASQKQIIALAGDIDVVSFTAAFTRRAQCPAEPRQHGCAGTRGGEPR